MTTRGAQDVDLARVMQDKKSKEVELKQRLCLRCDTHFASKHNGNRICSACKGREHGNGGDLTYYEPRAIYVGPISNRYNKEK